LRNVVVDGDDAARREAEELAALLATERARSEQLSEHNERLSQQNELLNERNEMLSEQLSEQSCVSHDLPSAQRKAASAEPTQVIRRP
jgi:formylmethanofuran dehydrogenase subunit E